MTWSPITVYLFILFTYPGRDSSHSSRRPLILEFPPNEFLIFSHSPSYLCLIIRWQLVILFYFLWFYKRSVCENNSDNIIFSLSTWQYCEGWLHISFLSAELNLKWNRTWPLLECIFYKSSLSKHAIRMKYNRIVRKWLYLLCDIRYVENYNIADWGQDNRKTTSENWQEKCTVCLFEWRQLSCHWQIVSLYLVAILTFSQIL